VGLLERAEAFRVGLLERADAFLERTDTFGARGVKPLRRILPGGVRGLDSEAALTTAATAVMAAVATETMFCPVVFTCPCGTGPGNAKTAISVISPTMRRPLPATTTAASLGPPGQWVADHHYSSAVSSHK